MSHTDIHICVTNRCVTHRNIIHVYFVHDMAFTDISHTDMSHTYMSWRFTCCKRPSHTCKHLYVFSSFPRSPHMLVWRIKQASSKRTYSAEVKRVWMAALRDMSCVCCKNLRMTDSKFCLIHRKATVLLKHRESGSEAPQIITMPIYSFLLFRIPHVILTVIYLIGVRRARLLPSVLTLRTPIRPSGVRP